MGTVRKGGVDGRDGGDGSTVKPEWGVVETWLRQPCGRGDVGEAGGSVYGGARVVIKGREVKRAE